MATMTTTTPKSLTTNNLLSLPGVKAISTERNCSNPADPYDGFNACHYTGDASDHIAQCRRELADYFGVDASRLIIPRQTHSVSVATIDRIPFEGNLEEVDALVTALPDVVLAIHTADCVPLVMADNDAGVIAAVHAGWRGAVGGIVLNALDRMIALGAKPESIHAAMGPCICGECFEVGEEVAGQFPDDCVARRGGEKPRVDLARFVAGQLAERGVAAENIYMPIACSRCNPDRFFSARRLGVNSGRTTTAIIRSAAGGAQRHR